MKAYRQELPERRTTIGESDRVANTIADMFLYFSVSVLCFSVSLFPLLTLAPR